MKTGEDAIPSGPFRDALRGYGTAAGCGFNDQTRDYKNNPTIENYLALRRGDPHAEVVEHVRYPPRRALVCP